MIEKLEKEGEIDRQFVEENRKCEESADANHRRLLEIIGCTYQMAALHDAPLLWLDVLANPEDVTQAQVDSLLPYQPAAPILNEGEIRALANCAGASKYFHNQMWVFPADSLRIFVRLLLAKVQS